mgnify:CR=1 FL=1
MMAMDVALLSRLGIKKAVRCFVQRTVSLFFTV